jgi:hypothetical protein
VTSCKIGKVLTRTEKRLLYAALIAGIILLIYQAAK